MSDEMWWKDREQQALEAMENAVYMARESIKKGMPRVAKSYAEEAAFYARRLFPELRDGSA